MAHSETGNPGPESPRDWITLSQFSRELPELFADRLPQSDGWGRDFLIFEIEDELMIASRGENGIADIAEGLRLLEEDPGTTPSMSALCGDDILLRRGKVANGPRTVASRQRQTMADLRSIGTATESYSIDNNLYPLQNDGLKVLESIESELEPIYIRTLPLTDAWGNPFLYWSNEQQYVIVSPGADGILDPAWDKTGNPPWQAEAAGPFDHPDTDIVFRDGQFVQWPRNTRR